MKRSNSGKDIAKRATAVALSVMTIAGATAAMGISPDNSPISMTVSAATTSPIISKYSISDGTTTKPSTSMTVRPGKQVTISATASGGSGGGYKYTFDRTDVSGATASSTNSTGSYSFTTSSTLEGKYTVKLTVKDSNGKTATKTFSITASYGVLKNNSSLSTTTSKVNSTSTPVITLKGANGKGPYTYKVSQSFEDQNNYKQIYTKSVADGNIETAVKYTLPKYTKPGIYWYKITLTDSLGGSSSVEKKVNVSDDVAKVSIGYSIPSTVKPGDETVAKIWATNGHPKYTYNLYISEMDSKGKPVVDSITGEVIYNLFKTFKDVPVDSSNSSKGTVKEIKLQTASSPLKAGDYKLKITITDSSGVTVSRSGIALKVKWDAFNNNSTVNINQTIKPKTVILADDSVTSCKQDTSDNISYATIKASAAGGSSNKANYTYRYFICNKANAEKYSKLSAAKLADKSVCPDAREFTKNGASVKTVNGVKIQANQKYITFSEANDLNKEYALLIVAQDTKAKLFKTVTKDFKVGYDKLSVKATSQGTAKPSQAKTNYIYMTLDKASVTERTNYIPAGWANVDVKATGGKTGYKITDITATYRGASQTTDTKVIVYGVSKPESVKKDSDGNVIIYQGDYYIKPFTDTYDETGTYTIKITVADARGTKSTVTSTVKATYDPLSGDVSLSSSKIIPSNYLVVDDPNVDRSKSVVITSENISGGHGKYTYKYQLVKSDGSVINFKTAKADIKGNGGESTYVHKGKLYLDGLTAGSYKLRVTVDDSFINQGSHRDAYKKANGQAYKPLVIEKDIKVEYESLKLSLKVTSSTNNTAMNKVGYLIIGQKTTKPADRSVSAKASGGSNGNYTYTYTVTKPDGTTVSPSKAQANKLELSPKGDGKVTYAPAGTQYFYFNKTGTYALKVTVRDKVTGDTQTQSLSFKVNIPDITFSKSSVTVGSGSAQAINKDGNVAAKTNNTIKMALNSFSGGNYKYYDYAWYVRKEGSGSYTKLTMSLNGVTKKDNYSASEIKKMFATYKPTAKGTYYFYVGLRDTDGHGNGKNDSLAITKMFKVTVS